MAKDPLCSYCQGPHYAMNCFQKPKKPIKANISKSKSKTSSVVLKRSPIAKKSNTTRAKAKLKAWNAFSLYVRTRDALNTTGTLTHCICVTCNERGNSEPKEFKKMQAGHAVGGRGNAVLFHEELVWSQCSFCNSKPPFGLGGDYGNYAIFLVRKYGIDHAAALQRLKGTDKVYKTHDFIKIEQIYKEKLAALLEKGVYKA